MKRDYTREHIKGYKISKYNNDNIKLEYEDITGSILSENDKKFEVKEQQYFMTEDGKKYNIDGKNVKIKANEKERQVAELLGKTYGGQVNLVPVVLNPQGIKTPDYILNEKKYDLKEIFGNSKNTIYNAITKKKGQSENFIFDISKTEMQEAEAIRQIQLIYKSKHKNWLNETILINNNKIIKIYQRQK